MNATPQTITGVFEQLGAAVQAKCARAGDKVPTIGVGEFAVARLKSKPSIVFVPIRGDARIARDRGGLSVDAAGGFDAAIEYGPQPLWDRELVVAARCYEADIDPCDELARRVVETLQEVLAGAYEPVGEEWDTAGETASGMVLVVLFRLRLRWATTTTPTVEPLTQVITPEMLEATI